MRNLKRIHIIMYDNEGIEFKIIPHDIKVMLLKTIVGEDIYKLLTECRREHNRREGDEGHEYQTAR
jgi:hypothetical protein